MVDKETKKRPRRSDVDKHNDGAGTRFQSLEKRLADFIERFDAMTEEMLAIKKQQEDLIKLIKEKVKK
jgi:predicted transcriptional regulator